MENTSAAKLNLQYKTHKKNGHGEMGMPPPIRTITSGVNTPVQPLSKLCSLAIQHLPEKLPFRNKSTKHVLKRIVLINADMSPISDNAVFVFDNIEKMDDNIPEEETCESTKKLIADPSSLGLSAETVVALL